MSSRESCRRSRRRSRPGRSCPRGLTAPGDAPALRSDGRSMSVEIEVEVEPNGARRGGVGAVVRRCTPSRRSVPSVVTACASSSTERRGGRCPLRPSWRPGCGSGAHSTASGPVSSAGRSDASRRATTAARALSRRDRSAAELAAHLARRGVDGTRQARRSSAMHSLGYVDDARFASSRALCDGRARLRRRGDPLGPRGAGRSSPTTSRPPSTELEPESERAAAIAARLGAGPKAATHARRKGLLRRVDRGGGGSRVIDRSRASAIGHGEMPFHNPISASAVDALIDLLPLEAGDAALDVGCGRGELLIRIAEASGAHGFGVDSSEEQIARARHEAATRVPAHRDAVRGTRRGRPRRARRELRARGLRRVEPRARRARADLRAPRRARAPRRPSGARRGLLDPPAAPGRARRSRCGRGRALRPSGPARSGRRPRPSARLPRDCDRRGLAPLRVGVRAQPRDVRRREPGRARHRARARLEPMPMRSRRLLAARHGEALGFALVAWQQAPGHQVL